MGLRRQKAADNAGQAAFEGGISRYLMARSKVQLYEPQWQEKLPTAVKILPEYDAETKTFLPYRTSAEPTTATLGSWRMPLPIVKWVGTTAKKRKFSGILYDPQDNRESNGVLAAENPYSILFDNVKSAAYNGTDIKTFRGKRMNTDSWLKYFNGKQEVRAFSRPQMAAFVPCVFYTNRGKPSVTDRVPLGLGHDDGPHMLLLTQSAAENLDELCCLTSPSHRADGGPDEYDEMFTYGDITRIDGGKFIIFANPKDHEFSTLTRNEEDDLVLVEPAKRDIAPYVIGAFDNIVIKGDDKKSFKYSPDISKYQEVIDRNAIDWFADDLFQIPSVEQLLGWLVDAFEPTPEILEFGWRSHPEYWESDVVQKAVTKRVQGFVPGAADTEDDAEEGNDDEEIEDADPKEMTARERTADARSHGAASHKKVRAGRSAYDAVANDLTQDVADSEQPQQSKARKVVRKVKRRKS